MKARRVVFSPEAPDDLGEIYDWLASRADPRTARALSGGLNGTATAFDVPRSGDGRGTICVRACELLASSGVPPLHSA